MTTRTVIPDGCIDQRRAGRAAAVVFFLALLEHGEVWGRELAVNAFAEAVIDELLTYVRSKNRIMANYRLSGFLSAVGEMLLEVSEEKRALIGRAESEATAETEPHQAQGGAKTAPPSNVIRFVLDENAEKRRPDVD